VAPGRILPSGRVKVVQPFEAGIVREILVQEGDIVRFGQPLVRLDSTLAAADLENLRAQISAFVAEQGRLRQILAAIDSGTGDMEPPIPGVFQPAHRPSPQLVRVHAAADAILAEQAALEQELAARQWERRAALDHVARLESTLPLISERTGAVRAMMEQNLVPRVHWLEMEEQRLSHIKQRDAETHRVAMLDADIAALGQRLRGRRQQVRERLLEELVRVEQQLVTAQLESRKAGRRLAWQTLTAPVSGSVLGIAVHTTGAVVTPAQELLRIVPADVALEAEARVRSQDIGFVHAGMAVTVKLETFPFTRYGVIHGDITGIAADAVADERLGPVFPARLRLASAAMMVEGKAVPLSPGMVFTAEFRLGRRRIIEYVLAPLLRYRDEALRER
jgi:hemolysin D